MIWLTAVNEILLQLAGVSDRCLVHMLLHQSPNFVVNRIRIWAARRPQICRDEFRRFLLEELDFLHARCAGALSYWNTNVSHIFRRCILETNEISNRSRTPFSKCVDACVWKFYEYRTMFDITTAFHILRVF